MQELMSQQATRAHDRLLAMVSKGAVHCRTHFLWAKLQAPREPKDPVNFFLNIYLPTYLACSLRIFIVLFKPPITSLTAHNIAVIFTILLHYNVLYGIL